ncbi:AT hook domain-containing protein [Colletotrichum graminicola]|uniref:Structure-specific endonuclease subunit SLX4 n=1 Tax=Colletotrichum graminicola (strain M1.001 / M2 / FGSC 10212) TaxID=645133 RepID=E3QRV4_COLGM|nr:AT hook domain-containing protein [Colletotrichum graminicola M1.001]EFQ33592.1 AT hook domain-containing protein [Colletotrichum graminicola M1.001]WDK10851.1 AT hook domain-containing protein [Colletotrichum graminicola]
MGSPFRSTRHDTFNLDSSPGLPSLDQLKSQFSKSPQSRSGYEAMPVPDQTSRHFTSASGFLPQEQSAIDLTTPCREAVDPSAIPNDEDVTVISIATLTSKPKRKRGAKVLEKKANEPPANPTIDVETSPPRRKYAKAKATTDKPEKKPKTTRAKAPTKKGAVKSHHFSNPMAGEEPEAQPPALPKNDADEPLELEAASRRRKEWTPPPADSALIRGSESSQAIELMSSAARSPSRAASKETFDNLLKRYGRLDEDVPQRPSAEPSDGDNPAFKKRKLIELVSVSDSSKMAPPAKGTAKTKAPRKKPRTITELATAAYLVPDATEQEIAPAPTEEMPVDEDEAAQPKGKKRAPRAKKPKKVPPPEPVLLSPTAALRQAANQDYVFGTSSQLAREHSPTFLRDLQTALQASNSLRKDPFVTPINSDSIEPESKQKLWDVGARDEDGRLLDLEVINLVDTPQALPGVAAGLNPFGYAGVEEQTASLPAHIPSDASFPDIDDLLSKAPAGSAPIEQRQAAPLPVHIPSDVSFPDIDELLGNETGGDMPRTQKEAAPFISTGWPTEGEPEGAPTVLISSGSVPPTKAVPGLPPAQLSSVSEAEAEAPELTAVPKPVPEIPKPKFDLYTDNQLAREIASYGFKPVKRRQAMLALLDQCWTSKQRTALASLPTNHPISTTSQAQAAALKSSRPVVNTSPKRPRGRPRKTSEVEMPSSEPPPSAQPPPPSPKRGRGRPKKNTAPVKATGSTSTAKKGKAKASTSAPEDLEAASPASSSRVKRANASVVIEIPDSASDGSLSPSPSAGSSPEPMFSPPPEEVSVSISDDTEMSMAASPPTSQSAVLFTRITEAVMSAPPTTDPKKPSFHEMMLMYDPIVLEDLTAWLNTGQLSRVGYDGEVSPSEVKQWCESKSVCCLWRESLRGKERKRY